MLCLLHSANILGLWAHLDQAVLCSLPTLDAVAWEGEGMLEATSPYARWNQNIVPPNA